jgi:flavin reductase (DIM6/NTAB) family NADH-FMN oxidoreductase RutF
LTQWGGAGLNLDMIDPREFRNVLGRFATGITVVTMRKGDSVHGITVNAFMAVSLEPPLVAVSIDRHANAHQTLLETDRYGVSVLGSNQEHLSKHFASSPAAEIVEPFIEVNGFPLINGALAHIICDTKAAHEAGDHTIFIGRVGYVAHNDKEPLLYYRGQYLSFVDLKLLN